MLKVLPILQQKAYTTYIKNKIKLTSKKLKWAYFMNLPIHYSDDSNFSKASSDMLDLWMQYYTDYEHFQLICNQIGSRDTPKRETWKEKIVVSSNFICSSQMSSIAANC